MKLRRILYVERAPCHGGSLVSLGELLRGLDRDRYAPVVAFLRPNPHAARYRELGVRVLAPGASQRSVQTRAPRDVGGALDRVHPRLGAAYRHVREHLVLAQGIRAIAPRVLATIRNEGIDLVHVNSALHGSAPVVLAARRAGVPVVCHARTLAPPTWLESRLVPWVSQFVYVSRAVEARHLAAGVPRERGQVVDNPVDAASIAAAPFDPALRTELGLPPDALLVSNLARLDRWKGQDTFVRAMQKVVATEPGAVALIVGGPGDGPQNCAFARDLVELASELGISERVVFTGHRDDVSRILASSEVVVHSATQPEPFGRTVAEAMAAGRPVVAAAAGGIPEYVGHRESGLLFPPRDAGALADAISELLGDRALARRLGLRAAEVARERFDPARHVAAVEELYARLLDG